jgi:DNA-binding IclR family transcriptional regulator
VSVWQEISEPATSDEDEKDKRLMMDTTESLLRRVQGEYREMAGLRLTPRQAARLWGLSSSATAALLDTLVGAGFLVRTEGGAYRLRD